MLTYGDMIWPILQKSVAYAQSGDLCYWNKCEIGELNKNGVPAALSDTLNESRNEVTGYTAKSNSATTLELLHAENRLKKAANFRKMRRFWKMSKIGHFFQAFFCQQII